MSTRHPNDARRATFAHLAYTSLFERVIPFAGPGTFPAPYAALVEVSGAAGTVGVALPHAVNPFLPPGYADVKDAFHVGVVNADGAHPIIIGTTDGTFINSGSGLILPASPGAFALFFFSNVAGEWIALVGGGGANAQPILSQTVTGTLNPIPNVAPATIVSLVVPVAATTQHIHMNFDCEVDTETAVAATTVTFTKRIDGVVSDTRLMTVVGTNSYIVGFGDLFTGLTVGNHTIDVQAQCSAAGVSAIATNEARLTSILLPG